MPKIIIGIDPDSKKNGVAVYVDGELKELSSLPLFSLYLLLKHLKKTSDDITVHIEDLIAVSAAFNARDRKANIHVKLKMAQSVGMCKQAQYEIENACLLLGIDVVKHKISKCWKKDKAQFELVTGWKGRSNEDTRSAAYFGWLGVKK